MEIFWKILIIAFPTLACFGFAIVGGLIKEIERDLKSHKESIVLLLELELKNLRQKETKHE